ncbi:MAG: twin-arginine translocation pathway signal protein [Cyanobacteria bacterium J06621_8]
MTINRRKFTKLALFGTASCAASSGIFFPKPAEAFSLDFLIDKATSRNVFASLLTYAGVKAIDAIFAPPTQTAINTTQQKLEQEGFEQNQTEYGQVSDTNVMWGQERQESQHNLGLNIVAPNPGFAVQNTQDYYAKPALFTASTSVGIDSASKILAQQQRLSPEQVKDILIPWQEVFEDITSWQGDRDPTIGENLNVGLTAYRARQGEVTRRYERVSPELGIVTFFVDSHLFNGVITTNVKFA